MLEQKQNEAEHRISSFRWIKRHNESSCNLFILVSDESNGWLRATPPWWRPILENKQNQKFWSSLGASCFSFHGHPTLFDSAFGGSCVLFPFGSNAALLRFYDVYVNSIVSHWHYQRCLMFMLHVHCPNGKTEKEFSAPCKLMCALVIRGKKKNHRNGQTNERT